MAESIKNLVVIKHYNAEIFLHLKSLFGILILILTVATTTLVTCLPHHNAIVHPEYWYESLYFLSILLAPLNSAKIIVEANMLLSKKDISIKAMIKSVIISLIGMNGTYMVIYAMWVHLLQYRFPIPFGFQITGLLHSVFVTPLSIWILYPSSAFKEDTSLSKRMTAFICMILLRLIIGVTTNSQHYFQTAHLSFSGFLCFSYLC